MPDLLHVVPVGDDAVLDGVLQSQDTPLALGLVADVGVLLTHTHHDTLVTGATNDGREDGPGGIVSGEASLHKGGSLIVVTHVGFLGGSCCSERRKTQGMLLLLLEPATLGLSPLRATT